MKKYIFIILTIVVISLKVSFVYLKQNSRGTEELQSLSNLTTTSQDICRTPDCVIATSRLHKRINFNVDPCDNFYDFACGTFVDETVIHERRSSYSTLSTLEDEVMEQIRRILTSKVSKNDINPFKAVKLFYQKCINRDEIDQLGAAPLLTVLKQLGGMPALTNNWNESDFNWETTQNNLAATGFNSDYLVDLSVDVNPFFHFENLIYVHQPYISNYYNRFYSSLLKEGLASHKIKAYYDYMVELMTLLGADRDTINDEMKKVLEFETTIDSISTSFVGLGLYSAQQPISLGDLKYKNPLMNWFEFIRSRVPQDIELHELNEEIIYYDNGYLEKLRDLIAKTPKRTIANYLFWRIADYSADYLSKAVRLVKHTFHKKFLGTESLDEGWKTCIHRTVQNFEHAVGAMFIQEKPEYNDKDGATKILQSIVETFQDIRRQSSRLDYIEKGAVLRMLQTFSFKIGAPEEYLDNNWLIDQYKDVVINQDTNYYNIILILNKFTLSKPFNTLRKSFQKAQRESVQKTESYYESSIARTIFFGQNSFMTNSVFSLIPPFYWKFVQQYLNYAGLGVDASYSMAEMVSDYLVGVNSRLYLNQTQCFVKQYKDLIMKSKNIHFDLQSSATDLAVINFSFKLSYLAYKRWQLENQNEVKKLPGIEFSPEQVFWISSAQIYCNKERPVEITKRFSVTNFHVMGAFQNAPEFSQDFNCKSGSYMNPVDKCQFL